MEWIMRWMLRLYPPSFRLAFGDEIAAVFQQSAAERRARGGLAFTGWLLAELFSGIRVALRLWLKDLQQGGKMETSSLPARDDRAPRWAIPSIIAFFLMVSLRYGFYARFPKELSFWLPFSLALLTFVVPLFVGLLNHLPRWSLLYMGVVLGGVGIYLIWITMRLGLLRLGLFETLLAEQNPLSSRLFNYWIYQGSMWLAIVLANGLFLALVAFAPGLRSQRPRFWNDFSLVSFLLYGGILVKYLLDFDGYRYDDLYVFASMAGLALGAWGYLRAKTPGWRTLALLAGVTICMASMSIGKYLLVPSQDWGSWLLDHSVETERWVESLQAVAAWFWAVLFIGLPGLIQTLRKTPPASPALTTA